MAMNPREIFLAGLRRNRTPRPAVGSATSVVTTDLMTQVGVAFPEAHLDPEAMARLAATGHLELGFDNVMPLFSVWHESAALGCEVDWGNPGRMPDGRPLHTSITQPLRLPRDFLDHPGCAVPLQALRRLRQELGGAAAIVGKVFGPWTLGFHLYGVEEFLVATMLDPDRVRQVMTELLPVTVAFARAQVENGADAITLADHCTRDLCSPETYRDFLGDFHRQLHELIPCPVVLHICGDTADRLAMIRETGLEGFHFDSKVPAVTARRLAGDRLALMGGTANIAVIRNGDAAAIRQDLLEKLRAGVDILGPECAVPLDAPAENLRTLAALGKELQP